MRRPRKLCIRERHEDRDQRAVEEQHEEGEDGGQGPEALVAFLSDVVGHGVSFFGADARGTGYSPPRMSPALRAPP